jgi:hypothetical protein
MAILNFPDHPQTGDQYTGDNGTTYIFDGVKWLGTAGAGTSGTNSIVNNGNTVQIDSTGKLVLPAYSLPNTTGTAGQVLVWPGSGTTLTWATQSGSGGGSGSSLTNGGYSVSLGVDGYLNLPNGLDTAGALLQSASPIRVNSNGHFWTFGADGKLSFPPTVASPVGTTTQAFGMGNLFAWEDGDNWTIATGNPSTGAFGETGISISPGIESNAYLNLPSDTDIGNGATTTLANFSGNVVIQSADGNWVFGKDNSTIFPNSTLTTDKLSIQGAPYTIQITDSGGVWPPAVNTYTRLPGLGDPKWVPANYNASSDSYITFSNGLWALSSPSFPHPVYVNTGTLYAPSATWNPDTQFGLGSGNPTGAYTYNTWLFDSNGDLTAPGDIVVGGGLNAGGQEQHFIIDSSNYWTSIQWKNFANPQDPGTTPFECQAQLLRVFANNNTVTSECNVQNPREELVAVTVVRPDNTNYNGLMISTSERKIPDAPYNDGTGARHDFLFGGDGYLTMESLHLQGHLKGVDGSTGSTGQVLTRQSNGGAAWANATGGSGSVVFRTVSYPAGADGDTQGTIAVDNTGKIYLCLTTWAASSTVTYSATNNTDYAISQSAGHLLMYQITPSTLPDIQALFGTFNNYQYNYPTPGDFTLEVPGITGPRTVTACGYLSGSGDIWFDIAYVSGDPTTVSIGDAVTIHYTPQQPAIWEKVGATGNIKFDGQNISTDVGSSIYIKSTSDSTDDTEVDIGTHYVDIYTYNDTSGSSAELYINNADHANPYAYIYTQAHNSASKQWTFNKDGNIVFPDNTVQTTAYVPGSTDPLIWAVQAVSNTKATFMQAVTHDSVGNAIALMWQGNWNGPGEGKATIVKLDDHGNPVWAIDLADGNSVNPWSLCCDANNDVYVITQRVNGSGYYNNAVVKLSTSNGGILWQTDIQDSQNSNNMQAVPMVYSSGELSFNGIVIAGTAYNGTDNDFFVTFINNDGSVPAPSVLLGDQYEQAAYSVAVNNTTGDILFVGRKQSNTDAHYYLEMVKLNIASPSPGWQKQVSVTGDNYNVQGTDCCLLADGNWAILATHGHSSGAGIITMKVSNTDGSVMWSREVSQGCQAVSSSLTTGSDGNIYISGITFNGQTIPPYGLPLTSRVVAAYNTSGTSLWQKWFGAPGSNSLVDGNSFNSIGFAGKLLSISNDHLLLGSSLLTFPDGSYPSTSIGVVVQIPTGSDNQVIGPFELTNSNLSGTSVAMTVADTEFTFSQGSQTFGSGSTISGTNSSVSWTKFNSGVRPNQLAASTKTLTLQTNGLLVDENIRSITGEFNGLTENTGNYSNSQISIRNASGYKRINNLDSAPQTWFNVSDVATQLGVNQYWITSVSMEFQVTSSGLGNSGDVCTMVGTILMAHDYSWGRNSVTHTETAIYGNDDNADAYVFANLELWNAPNGNMQLKTYRTDGNSGQQLDIMWTARVFINPMLVERYC